MRVRATRIPGRVCGKRRRSGRRRRGGVAVVAKGDETLDEGGIPGSGQEKAVLVGEPPARKGRWISARGAMAARSSTMHSSSASAAARACLASSGSFRSAWSASTSQLAPNRSKRERTCARLELS